MVECSALAHHRRAIISSWSTFLCKFVERFILRVGALHNRGCTWNCQVRPTLFHLLQM